ncbi:MarR family transcriptional regulator [Nocardia sp. CDC159]|uniref:MarR family transcriptional regulator n=1 Tax=Nocardia pulmonis TaxID=2951408 RepID=A0A9X2E8V4_9NOCA|nr:MULTISPECIES: MarR family transcriptional regulator [Nocardia]MCM6776459.1 MarR family transcriptional regulator [Nocardia pulmonis]MCM6788883.1 MarR family transcriptional regulator [Nocardia sp. CDC159]
MNDQSGAEFQNAFWAAKQALMNAAAAAYARHGVYEGQQFILRCLWAEDGLAPGEVAKRLGLSTPTVTRATSRMEAAGLLRREPHATDRRLVRLHLTARGRELERAIEAESDRVVDRALVSLDAGERERLVRALRAIERNLGRAEG